MLPESSEKLIGAIDGLTGEVKMFREVMEEFRVCFEWAVNNDRLCGSGEEASVDAAEEAADVRALVIELREKLQILTLVVEEIRGVTDRLIPKTQRPLFPPDEQTTR